MEMSSDLVLMRIWKEGYVGVLNYPLTIYWRRIVDKLWINYG